MANLSTATRKEQVLKYLERHVDEWIDGPDLANAEVGGSEGLKRVRELRADGHRIVTRPHPDRSRDIFQYKLVPRDEIHPVVQERLRMAHQQLNAATTDDDLAQVFDTLHGVASEPTPEAPTPGAAGRPFLIRLTPEGQFELTKEVCVECGGLYDDDLEHRTTDARHLNWLKAEQERTQGQTTIGVPEQPAPYKFREMPTRLDMSRMAICPRCNGIRRKERTWFSRKKNETIVTPGEDFTRDPFKPTIKGEPNPCPRCGGFGIVPTFVEEGDLHAVQRLRE